MSSEFWAGYLSGAIGIIVGNPLDLIKVRLQTGKDARIAERSAQARSLGTALKGLLPNLGTMLALVLHSTLNFLKLGSCKDLC